MVQVTVWASSFTSSTSSSTACRVPLFSPMLFRPHLIPNALEEFISILTCGDTSTMAFTSSCTSKFKRVEIYKSFVKPNGFFYWGHQSSWKLHPSQQHAGLYHTVWQLQQEITRPKARFKPPCPRGLGWIGEQSQTNISWSVTSPLCPRTLYSICCFEFQTSKSFTSELPFIPVRPNDLIIFQSLSIYKLS